MKLKVIIQYFIVGLFLMLVIVQADKKFTLDEIDFPIVSEATSNSGSPIYYRGEDSPQHMGIYHPTLYIHSLALFIKLFGYSENTVRMFGAISILGSAFMVLKLYGLLFQKEKQSKKEYFGIIFLALYLLNPYTIANATLPDIDSTILPVLLLIFLYGTLRIFEDTINANGFEYYKKIVVLGLIFSLNLWAKLTTPLILPVFLFLYLKFKNNLKVSFNVTMLVSLFGGVVFLTSYLLYCYVLNLPAQYTFSFLLQSFAKGTAGGISLIDKIVYNVSFAKEFLYWITIPTFTAILVGFYSAFTRLDKREYRVLLLIGMISLIVSIFYVCLISPFGGFFKYPFAVFAMIMIIPSVFFSEFSHKVNKIMVLLVIAGIIVMTCIETIYFSDSAFKLRLFNDYFVEIFVASIILWFLVAKYKFNQIVAILFIIVLGWDIGLSRVQAIASYPTKYSYGQTGLEEASFYMKTRLGPDDVIWSMKDIGYYTNNKYIESYAFYFNKDEQNRLKELLQEKRVKFFVGTVGVGEDRLDAYGAVKDILDEYATYETRIGNFVIYKNKQYE